MFRRRMPRVHESLALDGVGQVQSDHAGDSQGGARVLQVPTCRWSSYDARRLGVEPPANVPVASQERAVTSPVWYKP